MAELEIFTFDKGLNTADSPLALAEGELVSTSGFAYGTEGSLVSRPEKDNVNTTAITSIHTLHRSGNCLLCGDTSYARYKWDLDGYCDNYTPVNGNFTLLGRMGNSLKWSAVEYADITFIANGSSDRKAFYAGNWYTWGIDGPTAAPAGTAGASGNPSGTYYLYYTYLVKFPNGTWVETAPSPSSTVVVSSQKIEWSGITTCPYAGNNLVIHRKLYRYSTGLGDTYYIATIADNTTTTYSDNDSDATIQGNDIIETDGYTPPPDGLKDLTLHIERIFGIKENKLYYSEPYMPFTFQTSNYLSIFPSNVDCTACIEWGDQAWIASPATWRRLQGLTTSTWMVRDTYSHVGTINHQSVKIMKNGIISQWYDGLYLFDGTSSRKLTNKIADSAFTALTDLTVCYGEWDDPYYRFYTGSAQIIIDFNNYPKIKCWTDSSFIPTAHKYDLLHGIEYYGKSDGYQYEDSGTETIAMSLQTGDRGVKNIFKRKYPKYLWYDINTSGVDVTAIIYCDGTAQTAITINESSRNRNRVVVPLCEGYRFSLKISCSNFADVTIYEPWAIEFDYVGV